MIRLFSSNLIFPILVLCFLSCEEPEPDIECISSQDFGIVEPEQEAWDFLPYDFNQAEKLIFKNAEDQEIVFTPGDESLVRFENENSQVFSCPDGNTNQLDYSVVEYRFSYHSTNSYSLLFQLKVEGIKELEDVDQSVRFFDLLKITLSRVENRNIVFEDLCDLKIPTSFHGQVPFDVSYNFENFELKEEVEWQGKLFTEVYTSSCANGLEILFSKNAGFFAFKDVEGMEWVIDRTESFNEEIAFNLELPDTANNLISLYDIDAKLLLIDFWASWCAPCRVETEATLKPLYEAFENKGLEILSVSVDTEREDWIQAIRADHVSWPQVSDLLGYSSPIYTEYQVWGLPTIYVLDINKNILHKNLRGEGLINFVEDYLN